MDIDKEENDNLKGIVKNLHFKTIKNFTHCFLPLSSLSLPLQNQIPSVLYCFIGSEEIQV